MQENLGNKKNEISSRTQRRVNVVQGDKGHKAFNRSESFWRALFQEFDGSFLKVKEFCAQKGVATSTFHYWRRKLTFGEKQSAFQDAPLFVPVKVGIEAIPQRKRMGLNEQMREKMNALEIRHHDGVPRDVPSGMSFRAAFVLCIGSDMRLEIPSAFETKDLQRLIHILYPEN
jgi:transposase-like protein